jgi:hypothetical protein
MTFTTTGPCEAVDRLMAAAAAPLQCDPVRDILGEADIASTYAVQRLLTTDSLWRGRCNYRGQRLVSPVRLGVGTGGRRRTRLRLAHRAAHPGRRGRLHRAGLGLSGQPARRAPGQQVRGPDRLNWFGRGVFRRGDAMTRTKGRRHRFGQYRHGPWESNA